MRLLAAILLLIAGLSSAEAKGPKVERIEVVDTGFIKLLEKAKTIEDDDLSTGTRTQVSKSKITKSTTDIAARVGDIFGADFKMIGPSKGQKVSLTIIWRYPEPGIKPPGKEGEPKMVDKYDDLFTTGATSTVYWSLAEDWAIVPGTWSVELWQDGRKLMEQEFEISRIGSTDDEDDEASGRQDTTVGKSQK